jgi:glycosyltransferase involved in cell wall biosynthesis
VTAPREAPVVSVAVPSLNHGRFLDEALTSIFAQDVAVEVMAADGGSRDETPQVLERWAPRLASIRSAPDRGQSAAINECLRRARAPYVCWLNADDTFLPAGLRTLVQALEREPNAPMAYGRCWITNVQGARVAPAGLARASRWMMAQRCPISQPGTLIRRSVWDAVGGLDETLHLALDYDLWWRIMLRFGEPLRVADYVATSRAHLDTKTASQRWRHYRESVAVVRRHHGSLPLKWYAAWPYSVGARGLWYWLRSRRA